METLISTLIVTLLTGLTILAYKHPEGYKKIYLFICVVIFVAIISSIAWNVAISKSFSAVSSYIEIEKYELFSRAMNDLLIQQMYIWVIILANLYLFGLCYLHLILSDKKQELTDKKN